MKKKILEFSLVSILALGSSSAFSQVEQVTAMTMTNPAAMIASVDQFLTSGEATAQSITLLRHMHDGVDPSTHTVVAIFDDLDTLEASMDRRATSAAWASFARSGASYATVNSSALAVQRQTWGNNGWSEGDYLAAVLINSGEGAGWIAAVDEMMGSMKVKNPGMFRIVRLRGAPASHAVLIASSSYASLINFMDQLEASDAFDKMRASTPKTGPVGATIYKVAKVWNP